jgi:lipopolysaccharide/colanic/teichoic acid biosynthesis glycosyltransferase
MVHMLSPAGDYYRPGTASPAADGHNPKTRRLQLVTTRVATGAATERSRRILNVIVAATALIVLSPVLLLIALAVKLSSPGPVLFTQPRVGVDRRSGSGGNWRRKVDYGGQIFTIYKFRTMRVQTEADEVWARPDDPRITGVGRFLRTYRLDELPQLVNVLRGDMNVVGPRPEQPQIFMTLRSQIRQYPQRQRVLPGITGWAQINQQYDRCLDDVRRKVEYDLEYAARVSAMEDLKIMLRTLPVMMLGKGSC